MFYDCQSVLLTLCEMNKEAIHLIGTNGYHEKLENERFSVSGSRCRPNFKLEIFTSSFGRLRQRNVLKLNVKYYSFSLNKVIISLIFGVVAAVALVVY